MEERLAVHLPELRAASRGGTCHLAVPGDGEGLARLSAALPLAREGVAVLHVPPGLFQDVLRLAGVEPSGVLLRAELKSARALTALVVRELQRRGLLVRVLKEALPWVTARRALFGVLPADAPGGMSARFREVLLESKIPLAHRCYAGADDAEADPEGAAQQQRRGNAGAGRGRGLHRDQKRQAGR